MTRFLTLALLTFICICSAALSGGLISLTGTVKDSTGKPIPGAMLRLVGTDRGAISHSDGKFIMTKVTPGMYTLKVTAVGYTEYKRSIVVLQDTTIQFSIVIKEKDNINIPIPSPIRPIIDPNPIDIGRHLSEATLLVSRSTIVVGGFSIDPARIGTWQIWYPASKSGLDGR